MSFQIADHFSFVRAQGALEEDGVRTMLEIDVYFHVVLDVRLVGTVKAVKDGGTVAGRLRIPITVTLDVLDARPCNVLKI
jgi:hypothetical protein